MNNRKRRVVRAYSVTLVGERVIAPDDDFDKVADSLSKELETNGLRMKDVAIVEETK